MFKYTNALNYLLSKRNRRVALGDSTVIFWADHVNLMEDYVGEVFSEALQAGIPAVEVDQEAHSSGKIVPD